MKIALVSIYVSDPLYAHQVYTKYFGFVEKLYMPEAHLVIVASPEDPDGTSVLLEPNGNPIASNYQKALYEAGLPVIVFGVDDIHAEVKRLRSHGLVVHKEPTPTPAAGIEAIIDDSCGNFVQLYQIV